MLSGTILLLGFACLPLLRADDPSVADVQVDPPSPDRVVVILRAVDRGQAGQPAGELGRILLSGPKTPKPEVVWDGTNGVPAGLKKLSAALKRFQAKPRAGLAITVEADGELKFRAFLQVFKVCRDAGVRDLHVRGRAKAGGGANDPLIIEDIDPAAIDVGIDVERKADISVPGVVNPNDPVEVGRPPAKAPPAGAFAGRVGATREKAIREGGGTLESEAVVARGLSWLGKVQSPDGRWMLNGNFKNGGQANDTAGTAFGLLPFLAAGTTHKAAKDNPFAKQVEKGLVFLIRKQDRRTGNLGGGMYGHALATTALCEAYGLSQDPALRRPAQMAVNYLVTAQHTEGGWRYAPGEKGDTSVTGWVLQALWAAKMAELDVPQVTLRKTARFLDAVCDPTNEGYGYTGPGSTATMSAVGLLCRQKLQGWGPHNPRLITGITNNVALVPPPAAGTRPSNMYYYYYATQVMHDVGGEKWKAWNEKMRDSLVRSQDASDDPSRRGSWDPTGDPHATVGGRLMYTSLALLTLEVYYRHQPLARRGRPGGEQDPQGNRR
jgi:hypothetical protein